jgi:GT2 family glycosyltransferase
MAASRGTEKKGGMGRFASISQPELSIIIAAYHAGPTIDACLESLHRQTTGRNYEILLVESSNDGTAERVQHRFPEVRLIKSPERLYCGDARNRAMHLARARIIAFIDADCYVREDWVESVCRAHGEETQLVGGIIDNAPTHNLVSWAYYFCEFSIWLPAKKTRRIREMAGCCLSMKRTAYDRYGPFLEGTYCSDTAFHWVARRDGTTVAFSPSIRVYHQSPGHLGKFLQHVYHHRYAYARVRCQSWEFTPARRLGELALLPVTPFLLFGIVLWRLRRCWSYVPWFLVSSPLILLGYLARCCGECAGYLDSKDTPAPR